MASEGGGFGGCVRYGCFGCAGVLILALGAGAVMVAVGRGAARSEKITSQKVEEALPIASPEPEIPAPTATGEAPSFSDAPGLAPPAFPAAEAAAPRPGRMLVHLAHGEFEVRPSAPGEPLRIDASYDENRYELITRLDEAEAGTWSYEVRFQQSGPASFVSFLAQLFGASNPRVTVYLPRDVPMDLDLRFSQGGGRIDLGGLWLSDAKVAFAQGGGELEFSEPLREPIDTLSIDASMGGGAFRRLGNASPRELRVSTSMGGGEVDLRGAWRRNCEISLETSMGGLAVRVPTDVNTSGLPHDRTAPEGEGAAAAPTLTFAYSASLGEIEFQP